MALSILLVQTNRERFPQPVVPLGLGLVAAATAKAGYRVEVLDLCFSKYPGRELAERLHHRTYDVVGLSIRNIDTSDALRPRSYLKEVRTLVQTARQVTKVPLVIGGPAVSIAPVLLIDYLAADYAVTGQGERTFPALLKLLEKSGVPSGRVFSLDETNARAGDLPPAAGHEAIKLGRYLASHRWLPVQTKRGCTFGCVYCTYGQIEGTTYCCRPAESIVDELLALRSQFQVNSFEFVDSTLNHPIGHAKELYEAIVRSGLRPSLQSLTLHPGCCDSELICLMMQAGFCAVGCSPDSASDRVLQQLGKGFSSDQLAHAIEAVHQAGLPSLWFFVLGGPGETEKTLLETIHFIRKRLGRTDLVMITCGLRIYPGTELERMARAERVLDGSENLLEPVFYFSPELPLDRLRELLCRHADNRWLLMADTHHRAIKPLQQLHALFRIRKPFWTYARTMNRWFSSKKALKKGMTWR